LGPVGSIELWSNAGPAVPDCRSGEQAPDDLDWPRWLGPAGEQGYCDRLFEGEWRHVPALGGGWYRERISAQFALLPWLTGIPLTGRWRVRPLGKVDEDAPIQPQSLLFENSGNVPAITWQTTKDETHPIGWGMNIIGAEDSVWVAGGDARCAAETKVFEAKRKAKPDDDFNPNHRGNWLAAIEGKGKTTMPLKPAAAGLALAIAGQTAWNLRRETWIDLETMTLEDEEARRLEESEYAAPWKLPHAD
jgi:hypothetical protein